MGMHRIKGGEMVGDARAYGAWLGFVAALLVSFAATPSRPVDVSNGKALFTRCAACHTNNKRGPNVVGPNLFGVVGRKAASKTDFAYSDALKNSHIVWTSRNLDAWIANPAKLVPGTRMVFAGLSDAKQRTDLIAYLGTLK